MYGLVAGRDEDLHFNSAAAQPRGVRSAGLASKSARWGLVICLSLLASWAPAQQATSGSTELTPEQRAQRDADKVFHWITIHSDKPRKAKPEAKPAAVAAATTRPTSSEAAAPAAKQVATASASAGRPVAGGGAAATSAAASPAAVAAGSVAPAATQLASIAPSAAAASAPEDDDEDENLVPVQQAAPEFPASLLRALHKGSVQVRFEVQPDGSVGKAEIVKTSSVRLTSIATSTVTQWRFKPIHKPQSAIVELGFDID
ncbi:MAG TPA: TonB family protein [Methylibium sp.]